MTGTFASYPIRGGAGGPAVPTYATLSAFPTAASAGNGALAIALDTNILYESNGTIWQPIASPGSALSVGTFDSGTPSSNGAHIDSNALIMQSASGTNPGLVNVSTQTWAGVKTFSSAPIISALSASQAVVTDGSKKLASLAYATAATVSTLVQRDGSGNINAVGLNLSGLTISQAVVTDASKNLASLAYASANTFSSLVQRDGSGNFSATTITANLTGTASGNPPNARTISTTAPLTGGGDLSADRTFAITQATTSTNGYLTSTDWNTFNNKQGSGSYITALTGDVTATGPGSVAASLVATSNATLTTLSALTTASSLVSVGTITSGTWSATTIAVNKGGTGITSGTSGGILGYTATGTLASSGLLTANQLIIGGGAGVTPSSLAAGSQFQVLVMGATTPGYGQVNLAQSAAITGTLGVTNGGTGVTSSTGSGNVVLSTSPTLVTPVLGAATGTSLALTGILSSAAYTNTVGTGVTNATLVSGSTGVETLVTFRNSTPATVGALITDGTAITLTGATTNFGLRIDAAGANLAKYDGTVGTDLQLGAYNNSTTTSPLYARCTNSGSGTLPILTIRKDVTASATPGTLVFMRFESASGTSNGIIANANATTLQFSTPSDRRLKSNIIPIENCLDLITALNPVKFEIEGYRQSGFIAQEMYEVLPEFVTKTDNGTDKLIDRDKAWSISSPAYVTYLVGAIKELKQRIIALEKR